MSEVERQATFLSVSETIFCKGTDFVNTTLNRARLLNQMSLKRHNCHIAQLRGCQTPAQAEAETIHFLRCTRVFHKVFHHSSPLWNSCPSLVSTLISLEFPFFLWLQLLLLKQGAVSRCSTPSMTLHPSPHAENRENVGLHLFKHQDEVSPKWGRFLAAFAACSGLESGMIFQFPSPGLDLEAEAN